jgi:hypothetical protein
MNSTATMLSSIPLRRAGLSEAAIAEILALRAEPA